MRIFICFLLLVPVMAMTSYAESYSCRDKQGRLIITDNLQAVSDQCRAVAEKMKPSDSDQLNVVPQQRVKRNVNYEFQQQVREEDRKVDQKKKLMDNYWRRAKKAVGKFQLAIEERRNARRNWKYGKSRAVVQQATKKIEQARESKQNLLTEIKRQRLTRDQKNKIRVELDKISDQ